MHHHLKASGETCHWGFFDATLTPRLTIKSGDSVTIDTVTGPPEMHPKPEAGFFTPPEIHDVHRNAEKTLPGHILTGPVAVEGAKPGDVLEVRIEDVQLRQDWGYTFIRPLSGTLPEDFDDFTLRHIRLDRDRLVGQMPWGGELPLAPFFGVMGTAPPKSWGRLTSLVPRAFGGNIDNKEFISGTSLFLPVFVPGANLSVGDGHAVQGDGEVCLTALETCLKGRFQLIVHKQSLNFPRAITPTHYISMGMDVDLDDAAKQALRNMIKWLTEIKPWTAEEAYVFCSLACDLHVTQLVDGNKGIHAMVSRSVLGL